MNQVTLKPHRLTGNIDVSPELLGLPRDCKICLFDSHVAKINSDGVCEYCLLQEKLRASAKPDDWFGVLEKIKDTGKGKKYDVLVGISGGEDSSVMIYLAVKVWKLRVLAVHFDNHYNTPEANNNIDVMVKKLNVDFIRYYVNKEQYDTINEAMVWAGVPDADINNDCAMAKIMDRACKQYNIKYLLNGHDFRNEGSSPAKWSRIDPKYMSNIYTQYTGKKLINYPSLSIWDQVVSGLMGIRQVRPFHYENIDRTNILKEIKEWGWKSYGAKHSENNFTLWVGAYLLPKKFNIDKRKTYLSAQIREGAITKKHAIETLRQDATVSPDILGEHRDTLMKLANSPIRDRAIYGGYNFKRWKPALWVLMKLKVFPISAYVKYCK